MMSRVHVCKCVICGTEFTTLSHHQRYCTSQDCKRELWRRRNSKRLHVTQSNKEYTCAKCHRTFFASSKGQHKYCSKECCFAAKSEARSQMRLMREPVMTRYTEPKQLHTDRVWRGPGYDYCRECVRLADQYSHDAGQVNEFTPVNDPKRRRVLQDLREIHIHQEQCHGIRRNTEAEAKQLELRGL